MHPYDISQLKKRSPMLCEVLQTHKQGVLDFLLHEVEDITDVWKSACYHAFFHDRLPSNGTCKRCDRQALLLISPYNGADNQWCIDCILTEFLQGPIEDIYRDPRSREYDTEYAKHIRFWDDFYTLPEDYDGPPIVMA